MIFSWIFKSYKIFIVIGCMYLVKIFSFSIIIKQDNLRKLVKSWICELFECLNKVFFDLILVVGMKFY